MNRLGSLVLLIIGVALLAYGWDAYRSVSSGVSRLFTGAPTDRAMGLLIGGGVAVAAGLGGLSRSRD
ncbi:MAG: DUF3185 family protein [Elusimicrobiota bacterium]|nr:MAG: DUF3185 family protein [Elusimicrobiota bacterium]